jgi:hypothetical protein
MVGSSQELESYHSKFLYLYFKYEYNMTLVVQWAVELTEKKDP